MAKREDIRKILIIGSGPIIIGQACEFDYSGTQACRALKAEGIETVLLNSNPATIMTDPDVADHVYIEPMTLEVVERILDIEKPDSVLPNLGGQMGLNLSMELARSGYLDRTGIRLLACKPETIDRAEDRELFKETMEKLHQPIIPSEVVETLQDALACDGLLLPGGGEGLRFFFRPDFSQVTPSTVLVALGQAFFSLSISIGTMVTYASYFKPDTDLRHTALNVTILDTLVAVLAGVVIFPAVFSVGIEPSSGPSLVFITLPSIFNDMPLSMVWSSVFFLLLVVAALTSTISLHEVVTVYLHEEWHLSRRAAAWTTTLSTGALGAVASLSMGVLGGWTICGLNIFDSLDYLTANIMLPVGGLLTCLFVGWRLDRQVLRAQLTNDGVLPFRIYRLFLVLLRYFCPVILLLVFLDNLGVF